MEREMDRVDIATALFVLMAAASVYCLLRVFSAYAADLSESIECEKAVRSAAEVLQLVKVVDGDTVDIMVKAYDNIFVQERLRLLGVDTPEKFGKTKTAGLEATAFTTKWIEEHTELKVRGYGRGKFGRPLAILCGTGADDKQHCLNIDLIESGNAKLYCGGKRE